MGVGLVILAILLSGCSRSILDTEDDSQTSEVDLALLLGKSGGYSFSYVYVHGLPIAAIDENNNTFYLFHEGECLRMILNATGQPVWKGPRGRIRLSVVHRGSG